MRLLVFAITAVLISTAVIYWMYLSRRDKGTIKRHVKRWWWVPIIVFSLLFLFAVLNAQLTLKLF